MKRDFWVVFAVTVFAAPVFAQSYSDFVVKKNNLTGKEGLTITGYCGKEKNIIIPSLVDDTPVTAIGDQAFMLCGLKSVYLPEGIIAIGRQAFFGNNLEELVLPGTVTSVGIGAFDNNKFLRIVGTRMGKPARKRLETAKTAESARPDDIYERQVVRPRGKVNNRESFRDAYNEDDQVVYEDDDFLTFQDDYQDEDAFEDEVVIRKQRMPGYSASRARPVNQPDVQETRPAPPVREAGAGLPDISRDPARPNIIVMDNTRPPAMISDQTLRPVEGYENLTQEMVAGRPLPKSRVPESRTIVVGSNLSGLDVSPSAQTTEGTYFFQIENGGTAKITSFSSSHRNIVIPEMVGNLLVTTIGPSAFFNKRLLGVTIPASVVKIESAAFSGNLLNMIALPNSVRYVGHQAFGINQIQAVTLGSGVTVESDSFPRRFAEFYDKGGRVGGTYLYIPSSGAWTLAKSDDNVYIVK